MLQLRTRRDRATSDAGATAASRGIPAKLAACCLLAICLAVPLRSAADDRLDAAKRGEIRQRMQEFVSSGDIAGAVTVVGRKTGMLSIESVGYLDIDTPTPMPADAVFRIASMTKPITAIAIMILVDEAKLSVDDPVEQHLPEFRGQWLVAGRDGDTMTLKKPARPITVRDLLTHTSGLPGRMPDGLADLYTRRHRTLAEAVMAFSQRPLDFEPGSRWAYCNPGIDTLGRIVEVLSGDSFERFLEQRVFRPLGMSDTSFYPNPDQRQRLARLYERSGKELKEAARPIIGIPEDARYPIPAGGLCSTGADLAKLYQMMLGGGRLGNVRILSESSVREMTQLKTGDLEAGFTPGMGFGYGWAVVREPQGVTAMLAPGTYGHGGAFGTQGWIDPTRDLYVILLIQRVGMPNADASDIRRILQELAVRAIE